MEQETVTHTHGEKTFNEDDIWVVSMLYLKKKKDFKAAIINLFQ